MATPKVSNRTRTTIEQTAVERECSALLEFFSCAASGSVPSLVTTGLLEVALPVSTEEDSDDGLPPTLSVDETEGPDGTVLPPTLRVRLMREKHVAYLIKGLGELGPSYVCLDASRPWIIYWVSNALDILDALHAPDPTAEDALGSGAETDGGDEVELAAAMPPEMDDYDDASGNGGVPAGLQAGMVAASSAPLTARHLRRRIVSSIAACQSPGGGFGGGNQQMAHCAPTYAAVLALCAAAGGQGANSGALSGAAAGDVSDEGLLAEDAHVASLAYGVVNRPALYKWFLSLKDSGPGGSGGFRMHEDGEVDVRGTYTVVAVASLLNLLTPELTEGVAAFALACQTYEGGFGGEPGAEAHGGYTFCAVAALAILGEAHRADVPLLERWLGERQLSVEGGFAGRCNKLVDGCYTFWQGATAAILEHLHADPDCGGLTVPAALHAAPRPGAQPLRRVFNGEALQRYTLMCAQQFDGGLRDKPSKARDFYHTNYNLGGLSVAQHPPWPHPPRVWGADRNGVAVVHPVFNVRATSVARARAHFKQPHVPSTHAQLFQLFAESQK